MKGKKEVDSDIPDWIQETKKGVYMQNADMVRAFVKETIFFVNYSLGKISYVVDKENYEKIKNPVKIDLDIYLGAGSPNKTDEEMDFFTSNDWDIPINEEQEEIIFQIDFVSSLNKTAQRIISLLTLSKEGLNYNELMKILKLSYTGLRHFTEMLEAYGFIKIDTTKKPNNLILIADVRPDEEIHTLFLEKLSKEETRKEVLRSLKKIQEDKYKHYKKLTEKEKRVRSVLLNKILKNREEIESRPETRGRRRILPKIS